ncbi:hypothetical protein INR49_029476 [Caranx melampygus]|nr:hypothetical protein INR49_029476 [Caranx melampygus]
MQRCTNGGSMSWRRLVYSVYSPAITGVLPEYLTGSPVSGTEEAVNDMSKFDIVARLASAPGPNRRDHSGGGGGVSDELRERTDGAVCPVTCFNSRRRDVAQSHTIEFSPVILSLSGPGLEEEEEMRRGSEKKP